MLDGLSVTREAFPRTVRIVSSARLRDAVLRPLVETEDELAALAELESATSSRLIAQNRGTGKITAEEFVYGVPHANFINASFAFAKPNELNRFNGPDRGAWYCALDAETSLVEVTFHMTEFLRQAGEYHAVVEYSEMFASMAGEFLDLRRADQGLACLSPDKRIGYPAGNAIADAVRAQGHNGIIYPSIRHPGGTCIVALWPHAIQSVAQGCIYRATWDGNPKPRIEKV
jgi:hypothetical protein